MRLSGFNTVQGKGIDQDGRERTSRLCAWAHAVRKRSCRRNTNHMDSAEERKGCSCRFRGACWRICFCTQTIKLGVIGSPTRRAGPAACTVRCDKAAFIASCIGHGYFGGGGEGWKRDARCWQLRHPFCCLCSFGLFLSPSSSPLLKRVQHDTMSIDERKRDQLSPWSILQLFRLSVVPSLIGRSLTMAAVLPPHPLLPGSGAAEQRHAARGSSTFTCQPPVA